MACMESWTKLNLVIKCSFVSTLIAFISIILGFSTPVWVSGDIPFSGFAGSGTINHFGLWQVCGSVSGVSGCVGNFHEGLPAYYMATRVFACFSFISSIITTGLVIWYVCMAKGESGRALIFSMISSFVTGGLILITLAIFGSKVKVGLSFSFAMMCIADIMYLANGLIFLVYMAVSRR